MPNSRFPFQQSHTSLTHPSLPTEWHVSFITRALPGSAGGARGELPFQRCCLLPSAPPAYGAAPAGRETAGRVAGPAERERRSRRRREGEGGERLCWGGRLAEGLKRWCSLLLSAKSSCSTPWRFSPPVFFHSLFISPPPPFFLSPPPPLFFLKFGSWDKLADTYHSSSTSLLGVV